MSTSLSFLLTAGEVFSLKTQIIQENFNGVTNAIQQKKNGGFKMNKITTERAEIILRSSMLHFKKLSV